jgi:hypothetical protein
MIMKSNRNTVYHVLVAISCMSLTGCGSVTRVEPLGNGYERVSYTQSSISEPEATQITLQYRNLNERRVMIWPSVYGYIIKDDVAVFLGDVATKQPNPENSRATDSRLFAVKAPELSLDITDQVLAQGGKERRKSFWQIPKSATIATLKKTNDGIDVGIAFVDWTDRDIKLTWNQLSDIMREVKEKGVERKDRVWGTSYIEKEFKPETQK